MIKSSPSYNAALCKIYNRAQRQAALAGETPIDVIAVRKEPYAHAAILYAKVFPR